MIAFLRSVIVGLYAWAMSVFLGAVLVDVAYTRAAPEAAAAADGQDLLLRGFALVVLAGIGAFAASVGSMRATTLVVASLAILSLELLVPALLSRFIQTVETSGTGPWIRLSIVVLASILAFAGSYQFYRHGSRPRTEA